LKTLRAANITGRVINATGISAVCTITLCLCKTLRPDKS
jgi:hypothetical protein